MTFYIENETEEEFPFSAEEVAKEVCREVLEEEGCPYEVEISLILTDNERIREVNRENRGIDRETDVLSFPNVDFDPETGELILGDIMISVDKVKEQALNYGHSLKREFAFLVAHSMLHLCGYDHMEETEAAVMEMKQEAVLQKLGITRMSGDAE